LRFSRRHLLLAAAAAGAVPLRTWATAVLTPYELAQHYRSEVLARLDVPKDEVRLYGDIADDQLVNLQRQLRAPQYLLVVDRNPHVQTAFLFWRLLAGSYELVGASPASTGSAQSDRLETPQGLFELAGLAEARSMCGRAPSERCAGALRVYEFGSPPSRWPRSPAALRLQVRGADRSGERLLGTPCSDGCVLLPPSLIAFLNEYGVLDADAADAAQRHVLPYRGRHLLVVDSDRDQRPDWSPRPTA
jgi:hypothetical protein